MIRTFSQLRRNKDGAALTEFGLVAPIMCMMIMGIFDLAHTQYTESLITGAMQKAGRDLTLESAGSQEAAIDQQVIDTVSTVTPGNATVTLEKLAHFDFGDIGEAEAFTDNNDNDICDNGEPYEDANGNGTYDTDRGQDGIGGARDAVVYTAVVTYPRLFPIAEFIGIDKNVSVRASTILRNQPYDQQDLTVETLNCS